MDCDAEDDGSQRSRDESSGPTQEPEELPKSPNPAEKNSL